MEFTELSKRVIGCAIEVHKELGPGLLEATYERCLARELQLNEISYSVQHPLPVVYKGVEIDCGYRVDLLIENSLIVELKSVKAIQAVHEAQLITYLRLSGIDQGLLINFNVLRLKDGLKSFHR